MSLGWVVAALFAGLAGAVAYVMYRELRNQHFMWHDPCVTPADTRDDIRYVLRTFRTVLEGKGIAWWLDYGTLLGAWRLGDIMAFDHDVDLSFLGTDEAKLRACAPEFAAHGITLNMERTSIFFRGRKIGDIEPWRRYGSRLCRDDPARRTGVYKYWRPLVDDFPARWIEPFWSIRFLGELYPCPSHPARFLRRRYLTCRLHLRLVIPRKQKCWRSRDFWREAWRIWRFRGAPSIVPAAPAGHGSGTA